MNARKLGQTDIEISPIGLGCWQFQQGKGMTGMMWSVLDQATMDGVVAAALQGGMTWFDTAQAYGNGASERALSAALRHSAVEPGGVVVATKWLPVLKTARDIPRTIGTRMDCLRPYPIDLFQVHIPWSVSSVAAQMHEMASLVRAGKVRAVGVSNFSASHMAKAGAALQAEGLPLASNQVPHQPARPLDRDERRARLAGRHRRHADRLLAARPGDPHRAVPRRSLTREGRIVGRRSRLAATSRFLTPEGLARTAPLIAELRAVGEAHGATPAQVALAWLVTHYGDTVVAIPGASRPEHASAAAAAMDLRRPRLRWQRIDDLSAAVAKGMS